MGILFYSHGDDGSMFKELERRLPENTVIQWHDGAIFNQSSVTAAVVWMPPGNFFDGLVNLTHVYAVSAGVDQLLEHPGLPAEVTLVRLKDAGMAEQMEEYVLYGVLMAQRGFLEFSTNQRAQLWQRGQGIRTAAQTRVGILGAGALGCAVAQRLERNGYPVTCWSRTEKRLPDGVKSCIGATGFNAITSESDVLVCLLPLTEDTRGILDKRLFDRLPQGAFLINCARGPHLVEKDLLAALEKQQLSGALLDVFAQEPLPSDHAFWTHPSIVVTPHDAAKSPVLESIDQTVSSMHMIARGERPDGLVDRDSGY